MAEIEKNGAEKKDGDQQKIEDQRIPAMQHILENPFLLLFLGVVIPTVFYVLWGIIEIAHVPMAPSAYAEMSQTRVELASGDSEKAELKTESDDDESNTGAAQADTMPAIQEAQVTSIETALLSLINDADIAAGERAAKRCVICHSVENDRSRKVGPTLWDIVGRDIGKIEGFRYSPLMQTSDGVWTYAKLDEFLTNPRSAFPGTFMSDPGVADANQRANIIAYLRNLSDVPEPLTEKETQ